MLIDSFVEALHTDAVPKVAPTTTVIGRIAPLLVALERGIQIANIPIAKDQIFWVAASRMS